MKMLKNEHEVDASVTSRTPIPSLPSTKRGVALRYAARPPARLVQVHPDHHAEDGAVAVAVAEHADGAEPVDEEAVLPKKGIKTVASLLLSQKMCGRCGHAMAPRRHRKRTTTRRSSRRRRIKGGKAPFVVDVKKGFKLLTDPAMWKIPSKADIQSDKQRVANYKRQYRASGTKDSYNKWLVKKGYAKKVGGCSLM